LLLLLLSQLLFDVTAAAAIEVAVIFAVADTGFAVSVDVADVVGPSAAAVAADAVVDAAAAVVANAGVPGNVAVSAVAAAAVAANIFC